MKKYKNKDGIELNYTGNDIHQQLVKEVILEAIKILKIDTAPYGFCDNTIKFLKENFDIKDERERGL